MEEKKRGKGLILVVLVLAIVIGAGIYFFINKGESNKKLGTVTVEGYSLNQNFDPNIYEYNVTVTENKVKISCDAKAVGCNEEIDLTNKDTYTHKIIVDGREYKINIKKNLKYDIKIVNGNPTQWTSKDITLTVEMTYEDSNYEYSFDSGKTWNKSNKYVVKENGKYNIQVRIGEKIVGTKEVEVTKIDKIAPKAVIKVGELKDEKLKLEIDGKDEGSGIQAVSFNGGAYSSTREYTVEKAGKYYAEVKDRAGNISEKVEIEITEEELKGKSEEKNNQNTNPPISIVIPQGTTEKAKQNQQNKEEEKQESTPEKQTTLTFALKLKGNNSGLSDQNIECTTNGDNCEIELPLMEIQEGEFIGWSKNPSSKTAEYKAGDKVILYTDTTLYAISSKIYNVIFDKNTAESIGTIIPSCISYNGGTCTVIAPIIAAPIGYEAVGWGRTQEKAEYEVGEEIILDGNLKLYAITKERPKKTYSFRINSNGANLSTSEDPNCESNIGSCTVTLPKILESDSYEVIGWAFENEVVKRYDSGQQEVEINDSLNGRELYALTRLKEGSEKKFKVTFEDSDLSKITIANSLECTTRSSSCEVTLPTINKSSNYEVVGYSTNKNATSAIYQSGQKITLTDSIKLYVITKKEYTVTYDKNEAGNIGKTSDKCTAYNGGSCKVVAPTITVVGKTVLGWSTSKEATTASIKPGDEIQITKNITYYAITKDNIIVPERKYKLDIIEAGASFVDDLSCPETGDCTLTLPEIVPLVDGGTVLGYAEIEGATEETEWEIAWTLDETVVGKIKYQPGDKVEVKDDMILFAVVKYDNEVTFHRNNAKTIAGENTESKTYKCTSYGVNECVVKAPSATVASGTFLGWDEDPEYASDDPYYVAGEDVKLGSADEKNFYAITKETYKLTFNSNGAQEISKTSEECTAYNGKKCKIDVPTITAKTGGTVIGWGTKDSATTSVLIPGAKNVEIDGSATYYAITKNTYTATFNKNAAKSISKTSESCVAYNGNTCNITVDKMPTVTKTSDNQQILGWNTNKDATQASIEIGTPITLSGNPTYYAITKDTYTLNLNKNKATSIGSQTVSCYGYNRKPCSNPATFPSIQPSNKALGWDKNKDATNPTYNVGDQVYLNSEMDGETYYAIIESEDALNYIQFLDNNPENEWDDIYILSCIQNEKGQCTIKIPQYSVSGWQLLGWSESMNSMTPQYIPGDEITVKDSATILFPVLKTTYNVTFDTSKLDTGTYPAPSSTSCIAYNYGSCNVFAPPFNIIGSFNAYWSKYPEASSNLAGMPNKNEYFNPVEMAATVTGDTTFYPNVNWSTYDKNGKNSKYRSFNITKQVKIGNVLLEFEQGIANSEINYFLDVMNTAYANKPVLFKSMNKVFIMTTSTHDVYGIEGGEYRSAGGGPYGIIDVRYSETNYFETTLLHELGHAFDRSYKVRVSDDEISASATTQFMDFYNRLVSENKIDLSEDKKPDSPTEVFADCVALYYDKYVLPDFEAPYYNYTTLNQENQLTIQDYAQLKAVISYLFEEADPILNLFN